MRVGAASIGLNSGRRELFVEIDDVQRFIPFEQKFLDYDPKAVIVPSLIGKTKPLKVVDRLGVEHKFSGLVTHQTLLDIVIDYFEVLRGEKPESEFFDVPEN